MSEESSMSGGKDGSGGGASGPRSADTRFTPALIRRGVGWLRGSGADADVVVSSRIRLARNLAGFPFLARAERPQRTRILDIARARLEPVSEHLEKLSPPPAAPQDPSPPHAPAQQSGAATSTSGASGGTSAGAKFKPSNPAPPRASMLWIDVHNTSAADRTLMVERHLISKEHARGGGPTPSSDAAAAGATAAASAPPTEKPAKPKASSEPRGVAISMPDETLSVMVNEEDHLRLQVLTSGLELSAAYDLIDHVDDLLEGSTPHGDLRYAWSERFGYLTACPTNVGTGIRVSVMLHLPGLKLVGEMDKVRRATRDMSLAVRGYYGEGSEAAGEFYQISNQTTLGRSEQSILHELEQEIIPQIVRYERAARRLLIEKRRRLLEDKVYRALGVLRHARLLTPEESIMLLSDVRLGVLCGLIRDVSEQQVNQLVLLTQPYHLQRALGREMDQGERREARADFVRQALSV